VTRTATNSARTRADGYTLVELIIVIAIIAMLAAMTVALWPAFRSSTATTLNADRVQGMLLASKSQATRDKVPTGVRLILSNNDPNNLNAVTQLIYISQPTPFAPPAGSLLGATSASSTVSFSGSVDFTGGLTAVTDYPVQTGDYLEINGGGPVHKIAAVAAQQLMLVDTITVATNTANWRIIRQPRPIPGEESVDLTGHVIIDLDPTLSLNVPVRIVQPPGSPTPAPVRYIEILFSPSGSVIGQGTTSNDKIILWVRDPQQAKVTDGQPVLIAIQIGTGLIGGYPVDASGPDPFINTRDPHASGM